MDKKRIISLQGLRAVAFLGIFLSHVVGGKLTGLGAWGVSVFLIMSGFLMAISYSSKNDNLKFSFHFAWKKIKRLYPLHICTMLVMFLIFLMIILKNTEPISRIFHLLGEIVLHTLLVQIWIPDPAWYATLNGVSWYLCVCFFSYLVFPIIFKAIKDKSCLKLLILIGGAFVSQIAIALLALGYGAESKAEVFSIQWITYYCPLVRIIDFIIGCMAGILYVKYPRKALSKTAVVVIEGITILLIAISLILYSNQLFVFGQENIKYTLQFTITSVVLVWMTARYDFALSNILSLNALTKLGDMTPYMFLIHSVVIKVCRFVVQSRIVLLPIAIIITWICTRIYIALEQYIKNRKNEKQIKN